MIWWYFFKMNKLFKRKDVHNMKKLISKILIVSMVLSLFVSSSLAANQIDPLEQKKQEVLASVEAQLRAQDALYMMDYFTEVVEEMYSPYVPTRASSYYAPNGGWMTGTISVVDVEAVFYDVDDTEEMYNSRNDEDLLEELIKSLLEEIPYIGDVFAIGFAMQEIGSNAAWSMIDVGSEGCCIYASYDRMEGRTTTVLMAWEPPYMSLGSSVTVTNWGAF